MTYSGAVGEGFAPEAMKVLEVLRYVDSVIDISRSSVQLYAFFAIAVSQSGLTLSELSEKLSLPRKAVLDAVRKLKSKGLVSEGRGERGETVYSVTDKGLDYFTQLYTLLHLGKGSRMRRRDPELRVRMDLTQLYNELVKYAYLNEVLVALGTAKGHALSLQELANVLNLSVERAQSYLAIYSQPCMGRLVEEYVVRSRLKEALRKLGFNVKSTKVMYRLTKQGKALFYRHPFYMKTKASRSYRLLRRLFGAGHPLTLYKRAFHTTLCASMIIGCAALALPQYALQIMSAWLAVGLALNLMALRSYG